ncbi:MAG: hypothetical protein V2I26_15795 [Halieaceae bacterium]|nr:hypothetical protein [Halieaceae bacterium]
MKDLYLLMHGIAVKKYCDLDELCAVTRLSPVSAQTLLGEALAKGRVVEVNGKYALTPAGQITLRSSYAGACGPLRADPGFMSAYEAFEEINQDLKQVITDWQTMTIGGEKVPNDHSDRTYDESIIDRIGRIHEKVEKIVKRLATQVPRMERYSEKLLEALERAEDGDIQWVSDARMESYHTLWFELHEDLLRLVGRERQE